MLNNALVPTCADCLFYDVERSLCCHALPVLGGAQDGVSIPAHRIMCGEFTGRNDFLDSEGLLYEYRLAEDEDEVNASASHLQRRQRRIPGIKPQED